MKKGKILSSLLAIFAFGIWTNVNAESYVVETAPDDFTTRSTGRISNTLAKDTTKDAVLANQTISSLNGGSGYNVIDYHGVKDNATYKAFCLDRKKLYAQNSQYKKAGELADTDYGIVYIITHAQDYYAKTMSAATAFSTYETAEEVKQMELAWMTQVAIWQYQDAAFTSNNITAEIFEEGVQINPTTYYTYSSRAVELWKNAKSLAAEAKTAKNSSTLEFTIEKEGSYELNKDAKTIKTGLISSPVSGFSLDLSNAPKGTKVYDETGKEVDASNITVTKFYLVFPIDNVNNYTFDFNVPAATLKGGAYTGYKYTTTAGDYQPLVLVTPKNINGAINFKGSHVEDTASMISRSIYLIGFLILIAGIGLIYANVKPNKEQA